MLSRPATEFTALVVIVYCGCGAVHAREDFSEDLACGQCTFPAPGKIRFVRPAGPLPPGDSRPVRIGKLLERTGPDDPWVISHDFSNGLKLRDNNLLFPLMGLGHGQLNLSPSRVRVRFFSNRNHRLEISGNQKKVSLRFQIDF